MLGRLVYRVRPLANRVGFSMRTHGSEASQAAIVTALRPVSTEHALIRVGGDGDGGYLLPDDLDGIDACFSPGVDQIASFEAEMIRRGIKTFQIDASIDDTPLKDPLNQFERKFLGIESRGEFVTLDDWVAEKCPGQSELVLQMDIEGAEWLCLAAAGRETLRRFRIIVVELHYLDYALEGIASTLYLPVLNKLVELFDVVHLHANNCAPLTRGKYYEVPPVLEVTLLRKDRSTQRTAVRHLPHELDRNCVTGRPSVEVPVKMYAQP